VTRETYVIFLMRNEDPRDISRSLSASSKRLRGRPMLLRRQTLTKPENWPHPGDSVTMALSAAARSSSSSSLGALSRTGGDGEAKEDNCLADASSASDKTTVQGLGTIKGTDAVTGEGGYGKGATAGLADGHSGSCGVAMGSQPADPPLPKRRRTLHDFFNKRRGAPA